VKLDGTTDQRFVDVLKAHGDFRRWRAAFETLPDITPSNLEFGPRVVIGSDTDCDASTRAAIHTQLQAFHPWRKGPFELFGIHIDSEWRSDWKWARVQPHLDALSGARVLDVGCGNGYFGWRALAAGADAVVGVDATLVYFMQHLVIASYVERAGITVRNRLLPLRFEALDRGQPFDVVLSMGVLYHQRDPAAHLAALASHARPGAQVVVETLIVEGREVLRPEDRYARMRNVHVIPDPNTLLEWMHTAGLSDARIVDVTRTTTDEQRTTAWMTFESLASALDPTNARKTIEGYPSPLRAVAIARS